MVDQKKEYVKAAGLTDEICMQLIKIYLEKFGESKASEITEAVEDALPGQLSKIQKSRKVSNILQKMKKNGIAVWSILVNSSPLILREMGVNIGFLLTKPKRIFSHACAKICFYCLSE